MRGAVGPSADAWDQFPSCWLLGLMRPSTGANRLLSGARSWCQNVASWRAACPNERPDIPTPWVLASEWVSCASPDALQGQQVCLAHTPVKPSLSWSWCSWPERALRARSLRFPSSLECLQSSPAGFQRQMLWGSFSLVPDSQAVEPDMGLWFWPGQGLLQCVILLSMGLSLGSGVWLSWAHTCCRLCCGFFLYVPWMLTVCCCCCWIPVFLIDGCSAVSWDSSVLMSRGAQAIPLHHLVQEAVAWHLIIKQMKIFIVTICSAIPILGMSLLFSFPKGSYFLMLLGNVLSTMTFWNFAGI